MTHISFQDLQFDLAREATANLTHIPLANEQSIDRAGEGFDQLKVLADGFGIALPSNVAEVKATWDKLPADPSLQQLRRVNCGLFVLDLLSVTALDNTTKHNIDAVPQGLMESTVSKTRFGARRAVLRRLDQIAAENHGRPYARRLSQMTSEIETDWGYTALRYAAYAGAAVVGTQILKNRTARA